MNSQVSTLRIQSHTIKEKSHSIRDQFAFQKNVQVQQVIYIQPIEIYNILNNQSC
ncbi:unnamed protein product [Paramecium octaurelia]|uniref:Uncharacterized protein n=1 Tax=Paramecium octaurelia TaxID=43137 RepID=A0A8S1S2V0_PAROT|nr:unnamed protein product [Paramecium octaurelia]